MNVALQTYDQLIVNPEHNANKITVYRSELDHFWLIRKVKKIQSVNDWTTDYTSLYCLYCRAQLEGYDLNTFFPHRFLTAKIVKQLTLKDLLKLEGPDYFGLIDLLSATQAMQILFNHDYQFNHERKAGLFYFNHNFVDLFSFEQQRLLNAPIYPLTVCLANFVFIHYKKYLAEEMNEMYQHPHYQHLNKIRKNLSSTLAEHSLLQQQSNNKWDQVNEKYLSYGLLQKVTIIFLEQLNQELRVENTEEKQSAPTISHKIRTSKIEVYDPIYNLYYLPGEKVEERLLEFLDHLNSQIEKCDRHQENPLIVAAQSYQHFISIHPFTDGNGRTGRLLTDLILRRYGILPPAWSKEDSLVALSADRQSNISPTHVLERLLRALQTSYTIINQIESAKL